MNHYFPKTLLVVLAVVLFVGTGQLSADTINVNGLEYKNVRIIDLQGETVTYLLTGKRKSAKLSDVRELSFSSYPQYGQAAALIKKGNTRAAINGLNASLKQIKDRERAYVEPFIQKRLIKAFAAADRFSEALTVYFKLIETHPSPYFLAAAPDRLPVNDQAKQQALARLTRAIGSTTNKQAKLALTELSDKIRKATNKTNQQTRTVKPKEKAADQIDASSSILLGLQKTIQKRQYDQALKTIGRLYVQSDVSWAELTYLRGQCFAGKKQHANAAIAFMRVAINFPDSKNVALSLIEAGKQVKAMGNDAGAKRIWNEAMKKTKDKKQQQLIDRLLETVK